MIIAVFPRMKFAPPLRMRFDGKNRVTLVVTASEKQKSSNLDGDQYNKESCVFTLGKYLLNFSVRNSRKY